MPAIFIECIFLGWVKFRSWRPSIISFHGHRGKSLWTTKTYSQSEWIIHALKLARNAAQGWFFCKKLPIFFRDAKADGTPMLPPPGWFHGVTRFGALGKLTLQVFLRFRISFSCPIIFLAKLINGETKWPACPSRDRLDNPAK
jgi:hypothetical protein